MKMNNTRFFVAIASLLLLAAGCAMNDVDNGSTPALRRGTSPVFTSSFEQAETRTYVDSDLYMYWTADDRLSIFTSSYNEQYRFDGQTGATGGSFSKVTTGQFVTGNPISTNYGVYPYNASTALTKEEKIELELPAVQQYAVNSFGVGANTMVAVTAGTDDFFLPFKNVCGYLVVKLYGDATVKTVTFEGNNGEKIAGAATVVASHNADPVVTMSNDATTSISIDCGQGIELGKTPETATEFWFVIPPTTFTKGFTIKAISNTAMQMTRSTTASRTIQRNVVNSMPAIETDFTLPVNRKSTLLSGPEFCTAIKQLNNSYSDINTVDEAVKRIVFITNSPIASDNRISDIISDEPAYLSWDAGSYTAYISTPGAEFVLPSNATYMFANFAVLETIENITVLNTENVNDMGYMFSGLGCDTTALNSLDLTSFNTANVTRMDHMFEHQCALSDLNVKGWNTGLVEDMSYMFTKTSSLEKVDLSNWKNESCKDFSYMFYYTGAKEIDLTNFNTDNAVTMLYMFAEAYRLETIDMSSFNTENVTDFGNMFFHTFNIYAINGLKSFDTSAGSIFRSMFNRCDALTELDCSSFDVTASTNCQYMFFKCMGLQKLNVSSFDITGLQASVFAFMMPKLQSIREIHYGDSFIPADPTRTPNGFSAFYADTEEESMGCQNPTKTVTIYCSPEVADYLVTTDMHYPHNGWHYTAEGIDRIHQPITINFIDWKTKQPINVTWPANERYPL